MVEPAMHRPMRLCLATVLICIEMFAPIRAEMEHHGKHDSVPMGSKNPLCDDGVHGIEIDWDPSDSTPYTCPNDLRYPIRKGLKSKRFLNMHENEPGHYCLKDKIDYVELYNDPIPTSGVQRPIWPKYGTYKYLPSQRWMHSMEHGTIVALYHPCTRPDEVEKLNSIVRACLFRHVITTNLHLSIERPLALYAWQNKLLMNTVDESEAVNFIRKFAHNGPENPVDNGEYNVSISMPANRMPMSPVCPGMS